jgi:HK97 family phage portal protein
VEEVKNDPRVTLLNTDTGDLLNPFQWKKALVEDCLTYGAGYSYINRQRNSVQSLNFVPNQQIGVMVLDPNPIFKKYEFTVYGEMYKEFQFIKLTRKTINGVQGIGTIDENNKVLSVSYNQLVFEDMLYRTGGQRKGFLKSSSRLSPEAMTSLKQAFANLYSNNSENVIILNNGLEFQESNNSSVEMQVNANKVANDQAIYKMFSVPVELLNGKATGGNEMLYDSFIKLAILPMLKAFETSLNRDLLLQKEKGQYRFEFETTEILRANILQRFQAYQLAIDSGILQVDEIRSMENWKPIGFDFIKLGLQDVLYRPETGEIYSPNTNRLAKMGEQIEGATGTGEAPVVDESSATEDPPLKGGENNNESGNQK